jgi:hypothetical protein
LVTLTGDVNPKKPVTIKKLLNNIVCQRGTNPTKIPNETKKSSKLATILIVYKKA